MKKDLIELLKEIMEEYGANYVTLRIFNDSESAIAEASVMKNDEEEQNE